MKKKPLKNMSFQMFLSIVFTLLITLAFEMILFVLMTSYQLVQIQTNKPIIGGPKCFIIMLILLCFVVGIFVSLYAGKRFLHPLHELKKATTKIASGDFDVKIDYNKETEIGELIKDFNAMAEELKNIETLRTDFISNVSHEFKTPLATISGYSTLLQDDCLSKEERDSYTKIILDATTKLSEMVSNILSLSRLENNEINYESIEFDLSEQIRQAVLLLESKWNPKGINFNIDLEDIKIIGYENLLIQVWINIIDNAIKFSKENSNIDIILNKVSNNAVVKIKDYGAGMSQKVKGRIFDKFYQGDESHSREGNGLGLSLVKRIIDLSKGSILVNSEENSGSEFIIIIPIQNLINS